jgi:hypothetical protein
LHNSNHRGIEKQTKGEPEQHLPYHSPQDGAAGKGRTPSWFQLNAGTAALDQGNQGHGKNRGTGKKINFRKSPSRKGIQQGLDDNTPADSTYRTDDRGKARNEQKSKNLQYSTLRYAPSLLLLPPLRSFLGGI